MSLLRQNFTSDFVRCLIDTYGCHINKSYREMAKDLKVVSHATVQHHILKLETLGVITIENKSSKRQTLHISLSNLKEMERVWQQD